MNNPGDSAPPPYEIFECSIPYKFSFGCSSSFHNSTKKHYYVLKTVQVTTDVTDIHIYYTF